MWLLSTEKKYLINFKMLYHRRDAQRRSRKIFKNQYSFTNGYKRKNRLKLAVFLYNIVNDFNNIIGF